MNKENTHEKRRLSILKEPVAVEKAPSMVSLDKRRRVSFGTSNQLITYTDSKVQTAESATVSFRREYVPLNDTKSKNTESKHTKTLNLSEFVTVRENQTQRDSHSAISPAKEAHSTFVNRFFGSDPLSEEENSTMEITNTKIPSAAELLHNSSALNNVSPDEKRRDSLAFSSPEQEATTRPLQKISSLLEADFPKTPYFIETVESETEVSHTVRLPPLKSANPLSTFDESAFLEENYLEENAQTGDIGALGEISSFEEINKSNESPIKSPLKPKKMPQTESKIDKTDCLGKLVSFALKSSTSLPKNSPKPTFDKQIKHFSSLKNEFLVDPTSTILSEEICRYKEKIDECTKKTEALKNDLCGNFEFDQLTELGDFSAFDQRGRLKDFPKDKKGVWGDLKAQLKEVGRQGAKLAEESVGKAVAAANTRLLDVLHTSSGRLEQKLRDLNKESSDVYLESLALTVEIEKNGGIGWQSLERHLSENDKKLNSAQKIKRNLSLQVSNNREAKLLASRLNSLRLKSNLLSGLTGVSLVSISGGCLVAEFGDGLFRVCIEADAPGDSCGRFNVLTKPVNSLSIESLGRKMVVTATSIKLISALAGEMSKVDINCKLKQLHLGDFELLLQTMFLRFDWSAFLFPAKRQIVSNLCKKISLVCAKMSSIKCQMETLFLDRIKYGDPIIVAVNRSILVEPPLNFRAEKNAFCHLWQATAGKSHCHLWIDFSGLLDSYFCVEPYKATDRILAMKRVRLSNLMETVKLRVGLECFSDVCAVVLKVMALEK